MKQMISNFYWNNYKKLILEILPFINKEVYFLKLNIQKMNIYKVKI